MGKEKKKGERGIATAYASRSQALRKLEVTLPEFRRLCILKGIYPQEPKHRKKASKGSTQYKTLYYKKDVQWLAHEPLLEKTRNFKVFVQRFKKSLDKDDPVRAEKLDENRPVYTLDHIVRERYPTFVDALRDIDDALSMIFLYATLPQSTEIKGAVIHTCRRLAVEFMHYIIASRSLRKVFLSIKGIYYQVEIEGQAVTWITPYQFSQEVPKDVDFRVMGTFVELYTTLLGFVNFRLYHDLNLRYPPQIAGVHLPPSATEVPSQVAESPDLTDEQWSHTELLESLSQKLARVFPIIETEESDMDDIPVDLDPEEQALRDKAIQERKEVEEFKKLFEGLRFFISRETPREALTFVIRSFGGEVAWDSTDAAGSSLEESDSSITHQVVDRPVQKHRYVSRSYVQPQWVFDCVNFRKLVPADSYAPGAVLPPHLSPFVQEKEGDYVPPDKIAMMEAIGREGDHQEESEDNEESIEENSSDDEGKVDNGTPSPSAKRKRIVPSLPELPAGTVMAGGGHHKEENEEEKAAAQEKEKKKLAIMMMTKKRRDLYEKIMKGRRRKAAKVRLLKEKRKLYEKRKAREKLSNLRTISS